MACPNTDCKLGFSTKVFTGCEGVGGLGGFLMELPGGALRGRYQVPFCRNRKKDLGKVRDVVCSRPQVGRPELQGPVGAQP